MKLIPTLLKSWASFLLALSVFISSMLSSPSALFAIDIEIAPAVTDVVKSFSEKYCMAISNGGNPEKAAEVASRQMITGLIFSGTLEEVMSVPKDDMASFVASEIFDTCGSDLPISKQDLNDYLIVLAESGEERTQSQPKPFKPFGLG